MKTEKKFRDICFVLLAILFIVIAMTSEYNDLKANAYHVITPKTYNPDAPLDYFCSENCVDVHSKVLHIEKKGKGKKAKYSVMFVCWDDYDGEVFTEKISYKGYKRLKIRKGKKYTLWVYQNETPKKHYDDHVILIRRGWK